MEVLVNTFKVPPREVAALTPYSAQREEIKKKLQERRIAIEVKTITESQGPCTLMLKANSFS